MMYLKRDVKFEDPAKGPHHCRACVHFRPEEKRCQIVLGKILPEDWCKKWEKKVADRAKQ